MNTKQDTRKRLSQKAIFAILIILVFSLGLGIIVDAMPNTPLAKGIEKLFGFGPSSSITVINTPLFGLETPINLKLTYVNQSDLLVTWELGNEAVNTEVVVNYNHTPTSMGDGYVLYDSTGTSVDDQSVNLDEYFATYYISAWSQQADGTWSADYASAQYEVDMSQLATPLIDFTLVILCLGITGIAYWRQNSFLYIGAGAILFTLGLMYMKLFIPVGIALIILGLYTLARAFLAGKWD